MKQVEIAGLAIEATSGDPIVILREHDEPHRLLPIFVGGPEAAAIALAVSGEPVDRPLTHDLMAALVSSLSGHLDAVEVTELRDGAYLASLAVHGPTGEQRLDTRPSDAIALALRLDAPLFVAEAVLDEAGTIPAEELEAGGLDDEAIDEAVAQFRSFLDDIDPTAFTEDTEQTADEENGVDEETDVADEEG